MVGFKGCASPPPLKTTIYYIMNVLDGEIQYVFLRNEYPWLYQGFKKAYSYE